MGVQGALPPGWWRSPHPLICRELYLNWYNLWLLEVWTRLQMGTYFALRSRFSSVVGF
jgi:hypothetical protein